MKIWLDDIRPAPNDYAVARSVEDAKKLIVRFESDGVEIELLDLDHDLGDYSKYGGDAINLLDWLVERGTLYPIKLHTANPIGRANMERIIRRHWK